MKRLFIILGLIAAALAVILSVTPLFKIAYIPVVAASLFGIGAFYFSREKNQSKKTTQLVFLLTIISLSITIYKSIFTVIEVGDVKELELKEQQSEENAIEELDNLELEEVHFEIEEMDSIE